MAEPYKYVPRPTDDDVLPRWKPWRLLGLILAAVVVLLIVGYASLRSRKTEASAPVVRFSPVSQWTADPGLSMTPAFSPDGKLVAYASDREGPGNLAIWLRPYPSGAPRRLTKDEFDATDPDFSPDGSQIVYHSERDGGGVYIVPVSGTDQPRLLAKNGMRPRFASNGKWIAYFTMQATEYDPAPIGMGGVYTIAPQGGAPQRIRPEFRYARYPVWSPDGDHLLFQGISPEGTSDWWVTPLQGGEAVRTHAFEKLRNQVSAYQRPERWERDKILFPATNQAYLHQWEIAISPQTWQVSGAPRQLTNGEGTEQAATRGRDGRMLFTRMAWASDIWSLPLEGDRVAAAATLQRVTDDHVFDQAPSLGLSSTKMVYLSDKTGVRDLWVNDLKTGIARTLTSFEYVGYRPVLSADENRVAYRTNVKGQCGVVLLDLNRGRIKSTASGCFNIWDWSPDGSSLLIYNPTDTVVSAALWKADSGRIEPIVSRPKFSVIDAGFSRDGKWIAFSAGVTLMEAEVFVAPFHGGAVKEAEWIPITSGGGSLSAWSPDGDALYFHSQRDGFHCIWAQKLNGAKRPLGDPYAIQHLHQASFGMYLIKPNEFHLSVTRDRLALNLAKMNANLWITAKGE
jgi:Tol biopolymer transport system component